MNWRDLMDDGNQMEWEWPRLCALLDTLASLLPITTTSDRYVAVAHWLRQAQSLGLITGAEHQNLRTAIANYL